MSESGGKRGRPRKVYYPERAGVLGVRLVFLTMLAIMVSVGVVVLAQGRPANEAFYIRATWGGQSAVAELAPRYHSIAFTKLTGPVEVSEMWVNGTLDVEVEYLKSELVILWSDGVSETWVDSVDLDGLSYSYPVPVERFTGHGDGNLTWRIIHETDSSSWVVVSGRGYVEDGRLYVVSATYGGKSLFPAKTHSTILNDHGSVEFGVPTSMTLALSALLVSFYMALTFLREAEVVPT